MVLEVAVLNVKEGLAIDFEVAFTKAEKIISSMNGYVSHELQKCLEVENQYLLLVKWMKLEDHEIGFRKSKEYQVWKELFHHFYSPFPIVQHYEIVKDE